ncbi:MAG TPA: ABC transporter ATP-binding protein/permease [Acholeplasmataceae bacterium]|nr:ABC transporter ATP-binding protein/permease [Acholeplasmataceae bacterium]
MIEARSLNKYFNRRKSNEIHVINDTSLKFPKTGLVCLLGPSGSGKTTLLNVLGGLDKVDSGEIVFKDYVLKHYRAQNWDMIRNRYFGYVFQNYVLLPDLTVYQNLEFVLNMLNLPKDEIDMRIDYALAAVGMENYKKRKPTQLSGGQQQRIAIARALVKSPEVVIADEPTGNLDEKNTTQIMNIIKKISRECLVILVTHERRLAEFYGDFIYELSDGKIVQERILSEDRVFQSQDDRNLYLQEFKKEEISADDLNIKYFFEKERPKLDLNIIFKDGTFYINSEVQNLKIKFIDRDSEIKVIDSKKPVIKSESIEKFDYYLPPIEESVKSKKNVLGFGQTLKLAFRHLSGMRRRQKLIYFVIFLSAIMVTIGFMNFFISTYVDETSFLFFNRNLIYIENHQFKKIEELKDFEATLGADLLVANPNKVDVSRYELNFYQQLSEYGHSGPLNSFMPIGIIENPKIVLGRLPEKGGELVIDKYLAEQILQSRQFIIGGLSYFEQLLDIKVYVGEKAFDIVGVVDNNNPNLYLLDLEYMSLVYNSPYSDNNLAPLSLSSVEHYYDLEDLVNGIVEAKPVKDLKLKDNQVLVNSYFFNSSKMEKTITLGKYEVASYEIVGVYDEPNPTRIVSSALLTDAEMEFHYYNDLIFNRHILIYSEDKTETISKVKAAGMKGIDMYQMEYKRAKDYAFSPQIYTMSLIIISASLIFLYFLMRSRLIARVYEVGVYRALGVRKMNVYKIFISEILVLTGIASFLGIGLVTWFVAEGNKFTSDAIYYPWFLPILSFAFMAGINTLVGLLPVWSLLRLTPSQILSKYDI